MLVTIGVAVVLVVVVTVWMLITMVVVDVKATVMMRSVITPSSSIGLLNFGESFGSFL